MRNRLETEVQSAQHIGGRREQQDVVEVADNLGGVCLAVLADGMGGMLMGRECAERAVSAFISRLPPVPPAVLPKIWFFPRGGPTSWFSVWRRRTERAEMAGCTLLAAAVSERELYWLSIGDSHIYLFRESSLRQLNTDHNLRTRLLKARQYPEEHDTGGDINLSALTSFVGISRLSEVDVSPEPIALFAGDSVLLCSDGLYNTLTDGDIAAVLSASEVKDKAAGLLDEVLARAKDHQDNVSLVVLRSDRAGGAGGDDDKTVLIGKKRSENIFLRKLLRFFHLVR